MNKFECAKENSCNVSGFEQWLATQGYAARDDADMDVLRDIYEAMDDEIADVLEGKNEKS